MPKCFFNINDGECQSRHSEGTELDSPEDAGTDAIGILPDIAREVLPDGDYRTFVSIVRNENDDVIFKPTLALKAEWMRK